MERELGEERGGREAGRAAITGNSAVHETGVVIFLIANLTGWRVNESIESVCTSVFCLHALPGEGPLLAGARLSHLARSKAEGASAALGPWEASGGGTAGLPPSAGATAHPAGREALAAQPSQPQGAEQEAGKCSCVGSHFVTKMHFLF